MKTSVHRTAIVDSHVELIEIGPYCVIEHDVIIGTDSRLRAFVELRAGTRIGANCYIDSGVKMSGDCTIEDNVIIRYDAIIARGCTVGEGTFIAPQVMTINLDHTGNAIGGAKIGKRCHIGTAAVLHPGITIVDDVVIGAKALVTRDCLQAGIYVGIPAKLKQ